MKEEKLENHNKKIIDKQKHNSNIDNKDKLERKKRNNYKQKRRIESENTDDWDYWKDYYK